MNRITLAALAALAAAALPARADIGFGTSLAAGNLDYQVESSAQQLWKGRANLATLAADVSFDGGFYVGASHAQASGGEVDFSFRGIPGATSDFKRRDSALTLGWAAANRLNSFIGVKAAQTDIDNVVSTRFSTVGYFVGLSYPISFGSSTLAMTGAVGLNSGTWKDSTGEVKDSAFGYSGGLKYAYAFSPRMVASAGLKFQRYSYDFTQLGFGTVDETMRSIDVSLTLNF